MSPRGGRQDDRGRRQDATKVKKVSVRKSKKEDPASSIGDPPIMLQDKFNNSILYTNDFVKRNILMLEDEKFGVCDICFLVDGTGSMGNCIRDLTRDIAVFFEDLVKGSDVFLEDWRAQIVCYRDHKCDGKIWYEPRPFHKNVSRLQNEVRSLQATGGGDTPESLLDGLYKVIMQPEYEVGEEAKEELKWRNKEESTRVIIAFTDAPSHWVTSIPEAKGSNGQGMNYDDIARLLDERNMKLYLFAPLDVNYAGFSGAQGAWFYPKLPNGTEFTKMMKQLSIDIAMSA